MTGSRPTPLQDLVPPILWRALRRLRQRVIRPGMSQRNYGQQQVAAYYDAQFATEPMLQVHHTKSRKYPLYAVVGDRVRALHVKSILDIGCGPGQMASLLRDLSFVVAEIFASDLLETHSYETLLATEFLEHVEHDIALVRRIPQGVKALFSVPNFAHESHMRHFDSATSVEHRYGDCLSQMDVTTLLISAEGRKFYIVRGVR